MADRESRTEISKTMLYRVVEVEVVYQGEFIKIQICCKSYEFRE